MKLVVLVIALAGCASAREDSRVRPAHDVVTGAGRIRGGGVRMDVSIGHAFGQQPMRAPGKKLVQGVVTP